MKIRTPSRVYHTLSGIRGTYSSDSTSTDPDLSPVVTSFSMLAGQLSPWLGALQPDTTWSSSSKPLDTVGIMHDYSALKRAHVLSASNVELSELRKLLLYYLKRIANALMRIAATNSDVADFVDVVPWSDYVDAPV